MYATHVPLISNAMRADPDTFARGVLFSILSARQPIQHVPVMLKDIDDNGEDAEALAMPRKREGWEFLEAKGADLWERIIVAPTDSEVWTRWALEGLVKHVPGLGIVKAAFVLQFLGHNIGCLDTHNLKRDKISLRAFSFRGGKRAASNIGGYDATQFDLYMKLAYGKAEMLWDHWCHQVAEMRDYDPLWVSELHLAILPDRGRAVINANIPF